MPPFSYLLFGILTALATGAVGFVPLFGGPGYEHALATGLLVPTFAGLATALDVSKNDTLTPLRAVGRGVLCGLAYAGVALGTALLHAARVGICELWGALLYFGLTAGAGIVLGGAWGAVVGEVVSYLVRVRGFRWRKLVVVFGVLAAPLGCIALSVYRFYTSPMIFAFDPFVGYFSGTLYDTVIDAGNALLTYRFGSLATLVALALFASIATRQSDSWLRFDLSSPGSRGRAALGLLAAAASLGVYAYGEKLGHFSTPESIAKDLGGEKHGNRCDVVYPSTTREQEANLLVKDCDEEIVAVEKAMGTSGPPRVRAFFFRDATDKKRLMGAANTYIAKPWRREVYLQLGTYPHPVLAHELAHVVAGSFGRGSFRIAGDLGGILPNPGLIEGIAVAAAPDDEDLTDAQWAAAMMKIGILPSMQRVFSFAFLGDASSKSYTLAGAFISWIGTTRGWETVRAWYGGGDITALTAKDWPSLDREFRTHLEGIALPVEAESFARAKFARPGIFGRKCPHVVDALRHEADVCRDTQRYEEAIRLYREALSKDAADFVSQKELGGVLRRHGDKAQGKLDLERLVGTESVPRTIRDRAEETLADADFIEGSFELAAQRYEKLAAHTVDEDVARTLEVKALAAQLPEARPSVQALLLGDEKRGPNVFLGGIELGAWHAEARSPLGSYLIGRNLLNHGFIEAGAKALDEALEGTLPTPRLARETIRQRAIAACALSDQETLVRLRARIESDADPFSGASGGRRSATLRMIARCAAPN